MYVHKGQVVDKKPFSLTAFLWGIVELFKLFFGTIFTTQKMGTHVSSFSAGRSAPVTGRSSGTATGKAPRVAGFEKASSTGCAGGGG
jgi:hypothetical protein